MMEEPAGDMDLLYESMKAMNEKSDPTEEERKGGSGRIGKMIISKDQADSKIALVAYVPPTKHSELKADQWMTDILGQLGGCEMVFGDAYTAKAEIKNDPDKNLFVMKLKDSAITFSYNYLKEKGLFPDKTDDSDDDDYVWGDDDFPNGDAEEAAEEVEEEAAADVDDVFAMMGGMGEEQEYKVTLVAETAAEDMKEAAPVEEAAPVADDEEGESYPEITYGVEVPEKLTSDKMEKKMKKVVKEGGKGGLQFFCTTMDEPQGDVDLLYESMRAMNFKSDPTEEERKGGSGRIGKMIISKDQADSK